MGEIFREMPGLLLVFVLALLHRTSDWKVLRLGALFSLMGVTALFIPVDKMAVPLLIMIWSLGEHLAMPVRSSIAMHIAREGRQGQALGLVTSVQNAGVVFGSLFVASIFIVGTRAFGIVNKLVLYNVVWGVIMLLIAASFACTFSRHAPSQPPSRRPRLYFHRKFSFFMPLSFFMGLANRFS